MANLAARAAHRLRAIPATLSRPFSLALSLVLLSVSVLLFVDLFGLRDHVRDDVAQSRKMIVETFAMHLSTLVGEGGVDEVGYAVSMFVERYPDVRTASLTGARGIVAESHGDLALLDEFEAVSTLDRLRVPIFSGGVPWGDVRIAFGSRPDPWRDVLWLGVVALGLFASFLVFLGRVLVQLDPGRAVPGRVDSALNLFSAGVVVLDARSRIVMANSAAAAIVDRPASTLAGRTLDEWPWRTKADWQAPWKTTQHSGLAVSDEPLRLLGPDGRSRLYSVSCAFVGGESAGLQGVLVTLDDLTPVERKNHELSGMLKALKRSEEAIREKNRELELLATTDPLTGIANRRTLMERLALDLERARREGTPLACIMSDIDHFKSVNDTYGHGVGDDVIRAVAETLQKVCREYDTIGRYGGEEFVMVLPGLDARGAAEVAERVRVAVVALALGDRLAVPHLSSSFGVADLGCGASDGAALVDFADRALYAAKQGGRNRVEIHDPDLDSDAARASPEPSGEKAVPVQPSPRDLSQARVVELEARLAERERDIEALREFDTLTGVPMRTLFLQRVATELVRGKRLGTLAGVMSFELRDLERIVATLGHAASDALVIAFVERLQEGLRESDLVSVIVGTHSLSRVTSNEYGVLLSELADAAGAMVVASRLKRLLSQPFMVGEERVYVGANIGIALSGPGEKTAAALFGQASEARTEAAAKPEKVSHAFASAALDDQSHDYLRLEADLHEAIETGALETWFQPKFDLAERRVTGMEALLRWRHETRGFVSPAVFVPVAEANGMIGQLSSLVLGQTLDRILLWNSMGFDDLRISVNVSPMQLRAESLVSDTLQALERAGVAGRQLEIELTETSVLHRPEEACVALERLRAAGVSISMDDFGTGYTSLALLTRLPLDTVKIDRSFVAAMAGSERSREMVRSIIQMARALELRVVGEGVETNEELETLSRFGCDEVQGYLISHPRPADEICAFLVRQRAAERVRRA